MSGYPNRAYGSYNGPPAAQTYSSAPPPSQPYSSAGPPSQSYPQAAPPSQSYPQAAPPSQPYTSDPYSATAPSAASPYWAPPPGQSPYGATSYSAPSAPYASDPSKPQKENKPQHSAPYGGSYLTPPASAPYGSSPFSNLLPSTFPPGTDPNVVACFQIADQDGSGLIDDKELQRALSSYNQSFSLRTVHLLMYLFTNTNAHKIGPKEFTALFYSLQVWRGNFERFDRDRSGKIDATELREALFSLGFAVSPTVVDLLVTKFDKTGGKNKSIEYDNFIECCLTVKGLTEKFKEKDSGYTGSATFTYESFMLTVLPFFIA